MLPPDVTAELLELKNLAWSLHKAFEALSPEAKESLKTQGIFKLQREYLRSSAWTLIMGVNRLLKARETA